MSTGLSHLNFSGIGMLSGEDGPPELEWWEIWQLQIEKDELEQILDQLELKRFEDWLDDPSDEIF